MLCWLCLLGDISVASINRSQCWSWKAGLLTAIPLLSCQTTLFFLSKCVFYVPQEEATLYLEVVVDLLTNTKELSLG